MYNMIQELLFSSERRRSSIIERVTLGHVFQG
jgi:hypothetical protein